MENRESLGINPLTRPFEYIQLSGKLTLYAKRDCTDQLRATRGISVSIASRERSEDLYLVTARATDRTGRTDESIGAVSLVGLKGEALANALMKCETKGKRRVTFSIVGLGWLDETKIETIADARLPTRSPEEHVPPSGTAQPTAAIITDAQRRQLFALCKDANLTTDQLKAWLVDVIRIASTSQIAMVDYEDICRAVKSGEVVEWCRTHVGDATASA